MSTEILTNRIRELAKMQGFTDCGIAPAGKLEQDARRLHRWLDAGMHAGMKYMENHAGKRVDPTSLVPGAKSVILVLLNYFPEKQQNNGDNLLISKYAYGRDYHKTMKSMLKSFLRAVEEEIAPISGRVFVDSMPVLERALAAMAGLGWIGKNANLISPEYGSFCFIGGLITDIELSCNERILPDFCGSCTRCIDACPTGAIVEDKIIDSRKCISYWTIENKGDIEKSLKGKFSNRIFGCDICQDVCPWNRKAMPDQNGRFTPSPGLLEMTRNDWIELNEVRFDELFQSSAVKRARFEGFVRNIRFVTA